MDKVIKECPFCKAEAKLQRCGNWGDSYKVKCQGPCKAESGWSDDAELVIRWWNKALRQEGK